MRAILSLAVGLGLASCNTLSTPQTQQIPGGQTPTGGPDWALPPGAKGNEKMSAVNPDIAIPTRGIAGSWSGGRLAKQLTPNIRQTMIDLTQSALTQGEAGKTIKWSRGSLSGTIVPQVAFTGPTNAQCREFHQTLRQAGTVETGYATACRTRSGQWRLLAE